MKSTMCVPTVSACVVFALTAFVPDLLSVATAERLPANSADSVPVVLDARAGTSADSQPGELNAKEASGSVIILL